MLYDANAWIVASRSTDRKRKRDEVEEEEHESESKSDRLLKRLRSQLAAEQNAQLQMIKGFGRLEKENATLRAAVAYHEAKRHEPDTDDDDDDDDEPCEACQVVEAEKASLDTLVTQLRDEVKLERGRAIQVSREMLRLRRQVEALGGVNGPMVDHYGPPSKDKVVDTEVKE